MLKILKILKIQAAAQSSTRLCRGNYLCIPLHCFSSFKQLFTHVRNLWQLFPVRPLGEALFQMPLWIPWRPYHPDLFVHLPGDSFKGLLKICEPCPPFSFLNAQLQHFEGCLLASNNLFYPMICHVIFPLVFLKLFEEKQVMNIPSELLKQQHYDIYKLSTAKLQKIHWGGGGVSILCSISERSNHQTNSQVLALCCLPWPIL